MASSRPVVVALVDDYEVVLIGVQHMFDSYRDRIHVAEIAAGQPIETDVDIALCDECGEAPPTRFSCGMLR